MGCGSSNERDKGCQGKSESCSRHGCDQGSVGSTRVISKDLSYGEDQSFGLSERSI